MKNFEWLEGGRVKIDPPSSTLKITGTRFASILGLNKWSTPFEMWCEITKLYRKPFEDTIYTIAGKAIEPKQAQYMKTEYGMDDLVTPTDMFGEDYFSTMHGDFFHDSPILGGMWDYLLMENGKPTTVLEMKTSKRVEDWGEDIPEYYALQAALYAWLLGVDDVIMVASFLESDDYAKPEDFKCSVDNTITRSFKVSERYPDFAERVATVEHWWKKHITGGVSPEFDEKRDEAILKILRENRIDTANTDVQKLLIEAEELTKRISLVKNAIATDEKRLSTIQGAIKEFARGQFRDGDQRVSLKGQNMTWEISKSVKIGLDEDAMKADGVYDKYHTKATESYRLSAKK